VSGDDCGRNIDYNNALSFDNQVILNVLGKNRFHDLRYNNVYDFGDGVIVVLHDINRVTGRVLPRILQDLQEAGTTFLPLPRTGDVPGTMPVSLDDRPSAWPGMPGLTLVAYMTESAAGRTTPSFRGQIIAGFRAGAQVTADGRREGWIHVKGDSQESWVSSAQIRVQGPIHSLPLLK
jgi:hypothetical protein